MDSDKFTFNCIGKALSEQLTSQEDIKELLAKESDILSKACCDADRRLETLDQTVKDLEVQIEDQSHSICEVSKCAVQLLGRITDLTNSLGALGNDFKQDEEDRTISEVKHTSNKQQQKDDRKTNTQCPHTFVVQHDSEISLSRTYMNLQTEQRNGSPSFVLENSKPFTIEKRNPLGKQPCNIDNDTISVENELRKDDPIGTNERRDTTDRVNTKDRDGEEALSSDVYNSTQSQSLSSVDTACSGRAKHNKRSLFKNDFGYKQKHTESEFDNRISFHNKKVCFQGISLTPEVEIPSDSPDKPNIKLDDSSSDRMIAMALEEDHSQEFAASSLDSDFGQPKTINDWLSYAEEIRQNGMVKGMNGLIKRGNSGHNYVLVLDCSLRMKGQKFHTMIRAAKAYINGVRDVWVNIGLQDNIGLAVFGEKSSLITESTCDYDMLLKEIDGLKPTGEAPLVGGLLMGLSGVLSGSIHCMNGFQVQGFMIVFTDCQSENTSTIMDSQFHTTFYQAIVNHMYDSHGLEEAHAVLSQAVSAGIKIFYVPVEERCTNKIMKMALQQTQGKIVKPHEMHRLVKMTQTLRAAVSIASELRFIGSELSREMVRRKVIETTSINDTDDCVDLVFDLLNPLRPNSKNGQFTELNCKTLSLGDRVRRGPHWEFGDQDSNLPGTVIGQASRDHVVRVRWDSGDQNVYFFDENSGYYSIEKISNYRKVVDDLVAVGCRVQRGNDWTFDDEDGGRGCKGTVLDVNDDGTVIVRWDCRKIGSYKIGNNSLFEIELSEESNFTPNHSTAPNPDLVNEDDFQRLNEDVKIDKYIIPVASNGTVEGVWEYRNEDEWRMFSPDIQKRLEKIYSRNSTAKPILEIDSVSYCFDFRKMRKTHPQTRKEVEIRRKSLSDA